jgi:CRP-like cAMP-binding protein
MADSFWQSDMRRLRRWQDCLPATLGCAGKPVNIIHEHQQLRSLASDTVLFEQNAQPSAVYLVLKGKIESIAHQEGRQAKLSEIFPGMLCDIAACILGTPHNYTARTASTCDLVELPISVWRRLNDEFPYLSLKAADQLNRDLKNMMKQIIGE